MKAETPYCGEIKYQNKFQVQAKCYEKEDENLPELSEGKGTIV
jgi:hypothetical protein